MAALGITKIQLEHVDGKKHKITMRTHVAGQYHFRDNDPSCNERDFATGRKGPGDVYALSVSDIGTYHTLKFDTDAQSPMILEMSYWKETNFTYVVRIIGYVTTLISIVSILWAVPWAALYQFIANIGTRVMVREAMEEIIINAAKTVTFAVDDSVISGETVALENAISESSSVVSSEVGEIAMNVGRFNVAQIEAIQAKLIQDGAKSLALRAVAEDAVKEIDQSIVQQIIKKQANEFTLALDGVETSFADCPPSKLLQFTRAPRLDAHFADILADTGNQ